MGMKMKRCGTSKWNYN